MIGSAIVFIESIIALASQLLLQIHSTCINKNKNSN